jgi:hypothetical protein
MWRDQPEMTLTIVLLVTFSVSSTVLKLWPFFNVGIVTELQFGALNDVTIENDVINKSGVADLQQVFLAHFGRECNRWNVIGVLPVRYLKTGSRMRFLDHFRSSGRL